MSDQSNNPLHFLQGMWNQMGFQLPGMVTPTLDEGELDKQIKDLKSVENWLRMNLSMLQMTIQNLEMQKSALGTFRAMSSHFANPEASAGAPETPFAHYFQAAHQPGGEGTGEGQVPASPSSANASDAPAHKDADEAALAKAAMWPWEMMNEINSQMQAQLTEATHTPATAKAVKKTRSPSGKPAAKKAAAKPRAKKLS